MENEDDPDKSSEYASNHRNWPAKDAPEYLRDLHSEYIEAQRIPTGNGGIHAVEESMASRASLNVEKYDMLMTIAVDCGAQTHAYRGLWMAKRIQTRGLEA